MTDTAFTKLPRELRDAIWSELDHNDPDPLRTCKFFYNDVSQFFSRRELHFRVDPRQRTRPAYLYPSGIDMMDQHRKWPTIYPAFLDFSSPVSGHLEQLLKLDYRQFRSMTIDIVQIEPHDPGQFVRTWNSVVWMVDLIRRCPKPPQTLRIRFHGNGSQWLACSVAVEGAHLRRWWAKCTDLERLLLPFHTLRRLKLTVDLPILEDFPLSDLQAQVDALSILTRKELRFGDGDDWNLVVSKHSPDSQAATAQSNWSTLLDTILDEMDGGCASSLRLERFAFWSKGYKNNVFYRINSNFASATNGISHEPVLPQPLVYLAYEANEWSRYAFNPMSQQQDAVEPVHWSNSRETPLAWDNLHMYEIMYDDEDKFETDAWFDAYPGGIPKRSDWEHVRQLQLRSPTKLCQRSRCCSWTDCIDRKSHLKYEHGGSILCQPAMVPPRWSHIYTVDSEWEFWDGSDTDASDFGTSDQGDSDMDADLSSRSWDNLIRLAEVRQRESVLGHVCNAQPHTARSSSKSERHITAE